MSNELSLFQDRLEDILDSSRETAARTAFYKAFFSTVRPMFGALNADQVEGLKRLLWVWDVFPELKRQPDEFLVACLAYITLETGYRMQPVRETHANKDATAVSRLESWYRSGRARKAGVTKQYWRHDGVGYPFGRGDIQTTHRSNYLKGGKMLREKFDIDVDLGGDYSLALDPIVSALLAFGGCLFGIYTGKKLPDYWDGSTFNYYASRDIVNGDKSRIAYDMDKDGRKELIGDEIAGMASIFLTAIHAGREAAGKVKDQPIEVIEPPIIPEIENQDLTLALANMHPDKPQSIIDLAVVMADALALKFATKPHGDEMPQLAKFLPPVTNQSQFEPSIEGINIMPKLLLKLLNAKRVMGIARHLLTSFGGYIVAGGFAEQVIVNEWVGSAMILVGALWSVFTGEKQGIAWEQLQGLFRHSLTIAAGYLAAQNPVLGSLVTQAIPALIAVIGFVGSYMDKEKQDA